MRLRLRENGIGSVYAIGTKRVRELDNGKTRTPLLVQPFAMADGLYVGPALKISTLAPSRHPENASAMLFLGVPRPLPLTAWRAMKMLDEMDVVGSDDGIRCFYSAAREGGKSEESIRQLEPRLSHAKIEELSTLVPGEEELGRMLELFNHKWKFPVSAQELDREVKEGRMPTGELVRKYSAIWEEGAELERMERGDGRPVGVLDSLHQIALMAHRLARPMVEVLDRYAQGYGEHQATAWRRIGLDRVEYVVSVRMSQSESAWLMLYAQAGPMRRYEPPALKFSLLTSPPPGRDSPNGMEMMLNQNQEVDLEVKGPSSMEIIPWSPGLIDRAVEITRGVIETADRIDGGPRLPPGPGFSLN